MAQNLFYYGGSQLSTYTDRNEIQVGTTVQNFPLHRDNQGISLAVDGDYV
jgi:hypothetical protein